MAVETGYFVDGMDSSVPVMQVEGGVRSMAFETDERLGRGREGFQVDQGFEITCCLDALPGFFLNQFFGQILDSQAAGAVAGFTIHQGHAGVLLQLSPHGAGIKEQLQPVMLMTCCQTVFGANVISIKITDNHFFIFPDRQNRL